MTQWAISLSFISTSFLVCLVFPLSLEWIKFCWANMTALKLCRGQNGVLNQVNHCVTTTLRIRQCTYLSTYKIVLCNAFYTSFCLWNDNIKLTWSNDDCSWLVVHWDRSVIRCQPQPLSAHSEHSSIIRYLFQWGIEEKLWDYFLLSSDDHHLYKMLSLPPFFIWLTRLWGRGRYFFWCSYSLKFWEIWCDGRKLVCLQLSSSYSGPPKKVRSESKRLPKYYWLRSQILFSLY